MRVSLVELGVQSFPKGMEGWRLFRIEYGGHAENCLYEGTIWLPPNTQLSLILKIENLISDEHAVWI